MLPSAVLSKYLTIHFLLISCLNKTSERAIVTLASGVDVLVKVLLVMGNALSVELSCMGTALVGFSVGKYGKSSCCHYGICVSIPLCI